MSALIAVAIFSSTWLADDPQVPRLSMSPAIACSKIRGYGDYELLEEAALTKDDKLLVYYEPGGFVSVPDGEQHRVHLVQDGRIRRRGEKKILQSKANLLVYKGRSDSPPRAIYLSNTIALKDLPPGDYDLDIILRDEIGKGPPATQVLKFRVKPTPTSDPSKP